MSGSTSPFLMTRQNTGPAKPDATGPAASAPMAILRLAINAVPAVRYAAGVAGLISAAALVKALFSSVQAALLVGVAMLILMSVLLVFAASTKLAPEFLRRPALTLTWAILILFVLSAGLTASSVFFDWPKTFPALSSQILGESITGRPTLFHCGATNTDDECSFVLWAEDATGRIARSSTIVLGAGKNIYVKEMWRGGKYCVSATPRWERKQPDWPSNCSPGYPRLIGDVNY
jgi:hypothetical protein